MKTIASLCFGFALAGAAYGLFSVPATAVQGPAFILKAPSSIVKVEERERCEHVRHECRERHHDHDHEREYRECVTREHCEP